MEPTELYNRNKRNLAIFSSVLALVLLGAINADESTKLFGISVVPGAIPTALFFVVGYLLYQFYLATVFQSDEIKKGTRTDFLATFAFASVVLIGYLIWHLMFQVLGLSWRTIGLLSGSVLASIVLAAVFLRFSDTEKWRRETLELRRTTIKQRLLMPGWILNYRPSHPRGIKNISFNGDGTIGEGRNDNEYKWRLENDVLVLTRKDGELQNKFKYDEATDQFVGMPGTNAHGIENQRISRAE